MPPTFSYHSWLHAWALGVLIVVASGCGSASNGRGEGESGDSVHHVSGQYPSNGERIVILVRAHDDVRFVQIARVVRRSRALVGDRAVLELQRKEQSGDGAESNIDILLSPASPESLNALVHLIQGLKDVGVDRLMVVANLPSGAIRCDVYTSPKSFYASSGQQNSCVTWFYAKWSAESVLAEQTILHDDRFWTALTIARMPLVFVDCTRPTLDESTELEARTDSDVVPAVVISDHQSGKVRRTVFTGVIEKNELIHALGDTSDPERRQAQKAAPDGASQ